MRTFFMRYLFVFLVICMPALLSARDLPHSWIIPLGTADDVQLPSLTLESLKEFSAVETPSQFNFLENLHWAGVVATDPSFHKKIVPVYSYRYSDICERDQFADQNLAISVAATFIDGLAQDMDPGALVVISSKNSAALSGMAAWYESIKAACNEIDKNLQEWIELDSAPTFLNEITDGHQDENLVITAIPLWGVETIEEHWAICDTESIRGGYGC